LVKKKRKIPKASVEPFLAACEEYSRVSGIPAASWFRHFMGLIDRYSEYFFSEPWPQKFDIHESTKFSEEDIDFLFESKDGTLYDRLTTVCLRKNFYHEGFMGLFGMKWTDNAYHRQFVRPTFEPVLEAFDAINQEKDPRKVLNKLMEDYELEHIHDSLIDLLETTYPEKPVRKLIEDIFFLVHDEENLPSCGQYRCEWYTKQKEKKRVEKAKKRNLDKTKQICKIK
jgi:hypothetical protein